LKIALIGPPCAGKSWFAGRYVAEHPEFSYYSIDEFRIEYQDEDTAWQKLQAAISSKQDVIIESSGLSYRFKGLFTDIDLATVRTIALTGDKDILYQRLEERQKRPIPFPYQFSDERASIEWTLLNLGKCYLPINMLVSTTTNSQEEVYRMLSLYIAKERVSIYREFGNIF